MHHGARTCFSSSRIIRVTASDYSSLLPVQKRQAYRLAPNTYFRERIIFLPDSIVLPKQELDPHIAHCWSPAKLRNGDGMLSAIERHIPTVRCTLTGTALTLDAQGTFSRRSGTHQEITPSRDRLRCSR